MDTLGIRLKNYRNFPSIEWGEDGGTDCDIYIGRELFGHYYNDGNGGCGVFTPAEHHTFGELKELVEEFKEANKDVINPRYIKYYDIDLIVGVLCNWDASVKFIKKKELHLPLVIFATEKEWMTTRYKSVSVMMMDDINFLKSLFEEQYGPLDHFDYIENKSDLINVVFKKRK